MKNKSGFTLAEMVVVMAVVAVLSVILTPTIAKNINDAKLARANNECQVIGAAIESFFNDVGRWPTSDGTAQALPDTVQLLYGPGLAPAEDSGVTNEEFWLNAGSTTWINFDTFTNQLIENDPGDAANDYPTSGELQWRGPYLRKINADPWGSYYSCNVWYTYNVTSPITNVCVWSAGPDKAAQTDALQPATIFTVGGDDIAFRLQ